MKKGSFYEIEIKALITKEMYEQFALVLPKKYKLLSEETTMTFRYRPYDIRLRSSDKETYEFIYKEGDPTTLSRKEIIVPLPSEQSLKNMRIVLSNIGFKQDPPCKKHKIEVEYPFNGFNYIVCAQHIENFAFLLEVEHLSDKDDSQIHRPNLVQIIENLGAKPINPEDFSQKINEYIAKNQKY